jgi:hypothetical protein
MRFIFAAGAIAFGALIIWAIYAGDFSAEGAWLVSHPWGIVSLSDLYLGFALTAVVIAGFERPRAAVLWIIPLPFLGNLWALVWFALRFPALWRRLRAQ